MENVLYYLNELCHDNDTIVIATSGGPDSMCLLHLLCELKKSLNIHIVVAHVNHKLRIESDEEALFVKNFSKSNNLIYEYMEIKEYNQNNLESEARQKRYDFFKNIVSKYHAKYLMTAHHGDDLVETVMMRLVRGSSIKGYSGFKKEVNFKSYKIVRPLITVTKEEILDFMNSNNFKYFIDKSNFSKEYTRNRYRMDIIPFLKSENKQVHLKFLKFSQELEEVNNFLDNYIVNLISTIKDKKGINISKLLELDDFLIKKIVQYELSLIYIDDLFLISDNNTLEIIRLIKSNISNGRINLPNNFIALKEYNYFKIVYNTKYKEYKYVLDEEINVPTGVIRKVNLCDSTNNFVIRLNSKDIVLPIIVRNRKDGDKISIKNLNGTKKIKDILIDEKISGMKRDVLPIVTDSNNTILWIPGVKKSKFDVETNGIYDIILSYEEDIDEY